MESTSYREVMFVLSSDTATKEEIAVLLLNNLRHIVHGVSHREDIFEITGSLGKKTSRYCVPQTMLDEYRGDWRDIINNISLKILFDLYEK